MISRVLFIRCVVINNKTTSAGPTKRQYNSEDMNITHGNISVSSSSKTQRIQRQRAISTSRLRILISTLFWCGLLYILAIVFINKSQQYESVHIKTTSQRINRTIEYLEHLKQSNAELQILIDLTRNHLKELLINNKTTSHDYRCELLRHRLYFNTEKMWWSMQHQMQQLGRAATVIDAKVGKRNKDMLSLCAEHKSSLLNDMNRIRGHKKEGIPGGRRRAGRIGQNTSDWSAMLEKAKNDHRL